MLKISLRVGPKLRPNIIFGVEIINELGSVNVTLLDSLNVPCSKIVLRVSQNPIETTRFM